LTEAQRGSAPRRGTRSGLTGPESRLGRVYTLAGSNPALSAAELLRWNPRVRGPGDFPHSGAGVGDPGPVRAARVGAASAAGQTRCGRMLVKLEYRLDRRP